MDIRVRHDYVLLKRLSSEEKTRGGIVLPEQAQEKPITCTVLKVGPGKRDPNSNLIPIDLKPNDTVIVKKFAGMDISMVKLPEDLLFVKEDEILCVLDYGDDKSVEGT